MRIDLKAVRARSWAKVRRAGLRINEDLPLLEAILELRPVDQIADRLLAMFVGVACAFGLDRQAGASWARREGVAHALSRAEQEFLAGNSDPNTQATVQMGVHGLYALSWAVRIVDDLSIAGQMPNDLVSAFPELKTDESSAAFRGTLRTRSVREVLDKLDEAYCFHWSARDSVMALRDSRANGLLPIVIERRRALEWLTSSYGWDDVALDT
jgi:hypothetical protein